MLGEAQEILMPIMVERGGKYKQSAILYLYFICIVYFSLNNKNNIHTKNYSTKLHKMYINKKKSNSSPFNLTAVLEKQMRY